MQLQGEIIGDHNGMYVQDDNLLIIANVNSDNSGDYTCGGKNQLGSSESQVLNLKVLGEKWDLV